MLSKLLLLLAFFFVSPICQASSDVMQLRLTQDNYTYSTEASNEASTITLSVFSPYTVPDGRFEILLYAVNNTAAASDGQADYGAFDLAYASLRCPTANSNFNFGNGTIATAQIVNTTAGDGYYHLLACPYTGPGVAGDFGWTNQNSFQVQQVINPKDDPAHNPSRLVFAPIWVRQIRSDGTIVYHQSESIGMSRSVTLTAIVVNQLSVKLEGVPQDATACGQLTDRASTGTLVDFGLVNNEHFVNAAQKLTVISNLNNYVVTASQNDQLGLENGAGVAATCPGNGSAYDNCIDDASVANMSATVSQPWTNIAQGRGLAFTMENITGADATFDYTQGYRHFADRQNGATPVVIARQNTRANDSNYLCYRLVAKDRNLNGYYSNSITYTVTATF